MKKEKQTIAKAQEKAPDTRVPNMNFNPDAEKQKRFRRNLLVGRKTLIRDAFENLMDAFSEYTEKHGRQPEFPLEVRSKNTPKK